MIYDKRLSNEETIGCILVYATRYAITRNTYASAEVAEIVRVNMVLCNKKDLLTLHGDIDKSIEDGSVDPFARNQWIETRYEIKKELGFQIN